MQLEYVWFDGKNNIRSKTKIIEDKYINVSNLPLWNYDGSSTYQSTTCNSEIVLYPVKIYINPFLKELGYIVICKTSDPLCTISIAEHIFEKALDKNDIPMFGIEQEFYIIDNKTFKPLGWPYGKEHGDYYCSIGANKAFGRKFLDEAMNLMLRMGLPITGMNFEVAPGQAEFQICDTYIDASHGLTMMRYVLGRLGEQYNYSIEYAPKPFVNWNGSGCHVNFSTKKMREKNGYVNIKNCMKHLKTTHTNDLKLYGKNNKQRLTGKHETSNIDEFTVGVADRSASVRIPTQTKKDQKGYFEDRRPGSNIDPYLVTSNLYKVCCLDHISLYNDPLVQKIVKR